MSSVIEKNFNSHLSADGIYDPLTSSKNSAIYLDEKKNASFSEASVYSKLFFTAVKLAEWKSLKSLSQFFWSDLTTVIVAFSCLDPGHYTPPPSPHVVPPTAWPYPSASSCLFLFHLHSNLVPGGVGLGGEVRGG